MDKSSRLDASLEDQRRAWNEWNTRTAREESLGEPSRRQAEVVERWLAGLGRRDLKILDAGCGTGWMCERLVRYGDVVGIDLADAALRRARERVPQARFLAGDLSSSELPDASFDVVVTLEVLSHVADQPRFAELLARVLRPGGLLMLATQNRPVLERAREVGGPAPGQLRHWVDAAELRTLLRRHFDVQELTSVVPFGEQGFLRILNGRKFNRLWSAVLGEQRVAALKERMLLGHTLVVLARKR